MPAGLSMGRYLLVVGSALITMLAGSQSVQKYYQPLSDLDEYVAREEQRRQLERQETN